MQQLCGLLRSAEYFPSFARFWARRIRWDFTLSLLRHPEGTFHPDSTWRA